MNERDGGFILLDVLYGIGIAALALTLFVAYMSRGALDELAFCHQGKLIMYKIISYRQEKRYGYHMSHIKGNEMILENNHYYRSPYGSPDMDMGTLIEEPYYLNRKVNLNFTYLGEYQESIPGRKTMSFILWHKLLSKRIEYTISVQTGRIKMKEVINE